MNYLVEYALVGIVANMITPITMAFVVAFVFLDELVEADENTTNVKNKENCKNRSKKIGFIIPFYVLFKTIIISSHIFSSCSIKSFLEELCVKKEKFKI